MNELTILERLVYERHRIKAVVEALLAALEQGAGGNAAYLPFYLAVGQYVEAAMYRLHVQGVRMVEMIHSKLGEPDTATGKVLLDVEQALADNQRHLADLTGARERLEHEGAAALGAFEQVGRGFAGFLTGNIDHHKQVWQLAQKLFSVDDWAYGAGITEEEIQHERILYDRVFSVMSSGSN
jgi:hypothetical protein